MSAVGDRAVGDFSDQIYDGISARSNAKLIQTIKDEKDLFRAFPCH